MSVNANQYSTHLAPVWRDRANFIINAPLIEANRFEQLWSRRMGENQFEICCIPFFLYDLALGDIVETVTQRDLRYVVSRRLHESGQYTFRAFFSRPQYQYRDSAVESLHSLGALTEWSSSSLLSIAAGPSVVQKVADLLSLLQRDSNLVYETGKTVETMME
jgi:hypothetical protein